MKLIYAIKLLNAMHLPTEIVYNEIMVKHVDDFNDAITMGQASNELLSYITPIIAIKTQCSLNNSDIWPLKRLELYGNFNQQCLGILTNHSQIYQAVSLKVPVGSLFGARRAIELLKPKLLTLIFPNYNENNHEEATIWNNVNGREFNSLMEGIQIDPNRRISIIMMYILNNIRGSDWDDQMSGALAKCLIRFNIERLEVIKPILDYFDDKKFAALYEAISKSNLKYFSIEHVFAKVNQRIYEFFEIPLHRIEMLSKSQLESFCLSDWGRHIGSTIPKIVQILPKTVKELMVIFRVLKI